MGLLDEVLEVIDYKRMKSIVDAAETTEARKRLPDIPLRALVDEIETDLAREAMTQG